LSTEWYDTAFLEYPPYSITPMKAMYQQVAKLIPRTAPVVDLGCGNGYLASALLEANYMGNYVGLDFSPVAIEMAIGTFSDLTTPNYENLKLWDDPYEFVQLELWDYQQEILGKRYNFDVCDLTEWEVDVTAETHKTTYTCFEVLEHIEDDKDIVSRIPARSRFIFSVPNYWSTSHVRTYDSVGVAFNRFPQLRFNAWYIMPTKQPEAAIYLYDTYRRADKW